MIAVVGENIAAGTECSPGNASLVHLVNNCGRLFFSFR